MTDADAVAAGALPEGPMVVIGALARRLAIAVIVGSLGGLLIGGVLGRLAMRLLAVTSPDLAQGGVTDDQAVVGVITGPGTVNLALSTMIAGGIGGLIYLWMRRALPDSGRGRVLGYGLFTGAIGGALFLHQHGSFDYTVLAPSWLAIMIFVVLPALFGLAVAALIELTHGDAGLGRAVPQVVLIIIAGALSWAAAIVVPGFVPLLVVVTVFVGVAFAVTMVPPLRRSWQSRVVTVAGRILYALLVLWGLYGIVADITSIAMGQSWTLPLNP